MQTSGSSPDSSTGIFEMRSIQSWISFVTWGTIYSRHWSVQNLVFEWALLVRFCRDIRPSSVRTINLSINDHVNQYLAIEKKKWNVICKGPVQQTNFFSTRIKSHRPLTSFSTISINLPRRNIVITTKIDFTTVVQDIDLSCKKG